MFLSKLKYTVFFGLLASNVYSSLPATDHSLGKWVCESFCPVSPDDITRLKDLEKRSKQYAEGQSWLRGQNIAFLGKVILSSLMPGQSGGTCEECCDVFLEKAKADRLRSFMKAIKKTDRRECIGIVKEFLSKYKRFLTSISDFGYEKIHSAAQALEEAENKLDDGGKIKDGDDFKDLTTPLLRTWFKNLDNISFENSKNLHNFSHAETFCAHLLLNTEAMADKVFMYSLYDMCHVCEPLLAFIAEKKRFSIAVGSSWEYATDGSPDRDSEIPYRLAKVPLGSRDKDKYQSTKRGISLAFVEKGFGNPSE